MKNLPDFFLVVHQFLFLLCFVLFISLVELDVRFSSSSHRSAQAPQRYFSLITTPRGSVRRARLRHFPSEHVSYQCFCSYCIS